MASTNDKRTSLIVVQRDEGCVSNSINQVICFYEVKVSIDVFWNADLSQTVVFFILFKD